MTNAKTTKRALLSSIVSLILCFTMLLSTTYAWFTDTVTSANNIITAGNLDIELYYRNDEIGTWTKVDANTNIFKEDTYWEPGHTEVIELKLVNAGSLALKYQMGINVVSETQNAVNVLGESFKLSNYIYFGVKTDKIGYSDRALAVADVKDIAKQIKLGYTAANSMLSGTEQYMTLVVYMPENIGNEANYSGNVVPEIKLGLNLYATQMNIEKDSYDENYDAEAILPNGAVIVEETVLIPDTSVATGEQFTLTNTANTFAVSGIANGTPIQATIEPSTIASEAALAVAANESMSIVSYDIDVTGHDGEVEVKLQIGKNLSNVVVFHEGVKMDPASYSYDATSGILIFTSADFSPFDIVYRDACLDGVRVVYDAATLAEVLTADEEEIVVALANDIDLPISSLGQITGGSGEYKLGGENTKAITIDLNGKKLNITTTYWSNLGAKNADAVFTIKNGTMTSSQATGTWNSYDLCFSNCNYVIENVVFDKAIAFTNAGKSATLKNVTINETHDYYALWICAEGQNVEIDGLTINSAGRGIKIDEQYVGTPAKVTLKVSNAVFNTAKKAAIVVKSVAGADITLSNVNIANTIDTIHAVWVDEDADAYASLVTVTGGEVISEANVAANLADLENVLAKDNDVVLLNDITVAKSEAGSNGYGVVGINILKGQAFDGNGKNFGVNAWGTWDSAINTTGGVIKNVTVNSGMRGIFISHNSTESGKVYLENVTIDGTIYTISCDQGTNSGLEAKNSTFNGWTSYAATLGDAKFVDCSFGEGQGYAFCRPYAPTTFVGCDFEAGYEINACAAVAFENCTIGDVALTAENLATLVTGGIANASVK